MYNAMWCKIYFVHVDINLNIMSKVSIVIMSWSRLLNNMGRNSAIDIITLLRKMNVRTCIGYQLPPEVQRD